MPNQPQADIQGRGLIVAGLLTSMALAALDGTVVATAMPTIVGTLGGLDLFSWVFSIYLLTSTVTVPLFGKLADLYGRKRILILGNVLFLTGSCLCGAAQSMEQLIIFRAIQGIGAGATLPMVLTVIGDLFAVEERAKIQGLTSSVWGIAGIAGPVVGAFLTDQVSWRWVFLINVPFGLAGILIFWRFYHESLQRRQHALDLAGAALLSAAVVLLLLALLQGVDRFGWTGPETLTMFAISAVLVLVFVRQEGRAPEPLIPLELFRNRVVTVGCLAGFAMGALMFGISSYVPLFVQGVYGGSAIDAGLLLGPMSVSWPMASTLSGRLIPKVGYRPMALLGACCLVVGSLILLLLDRETTKLVAIAAVVIVGAGMGFATSATIISVQNAVSWTQRGIATAMTQFVRTIGGSIMVAVMGAVLATRLSGRFDSIAGVPEGASADVLLNAPARDALPVAVLRGMQEALAASLHETYFIIAAAGLLCLAVMLFFPRGRVEDLQEGGRSEAATGRGEATDPAAGRLSRS